MYDLLIKGSRVIDPAQNIDGKMDIAISGDKIVKLAKDIPSQEGRRVVDARDKLVTPGLIDMHCHVFDCVYHTSVEPDIAGVKQGVTTVGDGGSAGEQTFAAFLKYIIPPARTRIFCFLHLCSIGLMPEPELKDWDEVNLEAMADTIAAHRDIIKGVKLRLVGKLVAEAGVEVVKTAKKIAGQFGLPVMIHIGDMEKKVSPTLTKEFLPLLEPGDILTHIYTGNFGNTLLPDGKVMPEMKAAMKRGVIMDTAIGRNNLNFEVARKSLAQGIIPNTLSTDLTHRSLTGPTYSLPITMAKFMGLGLDLKQVVTMSTINPAKVLREDDRIGSLKPGMEADVSILELLSGAWKLYDAPMQSIEVDKLLMPVMTVKAGQVIPAQPVAQPQKIG